MATSTQKRTLSQPERDALRKAGEWGLLRSLAGRKVCLTGRMSMERTSLAALVEAAGGVFTNVMGAGVQLLVIADDSTWSNKIQAAEDAGTRCLRESEFAAELLPTPEELLSGRPAEFGAPR